MDPDKAFAVQIQHDESVVSTTKAYVQCALLYTSSLGERRIRYALLADPMFLVQLEHLPRSARSSQGLMAWCGDA